MEINSAQNYLHQSNGAFILEASSSRIGCSANSLINNSKGVWVSNEGLPQHIIIDISKLHNRNHCNFFGWYCWHNYSSNPSVIELMISTDYANYKNWSTFKATQSAGFQIFNIDSIANSAKSLKIVTKETFGASNTYINKLYLIEKIPKLEKIEKKRTKTEESFINISEISCDLYETPRKYDIIHNPKSKLKFQLEELTDTIKNIELKYQENNVIEDDEEFRLVKGEVNYCGSKIYEIKSTLKVLMEKISTVENTVKKINHSSQIALFKKEIIDQVLKNRSLKSSNSKGKLSSKFTQKK